VFSVGAGRLLQAFQDSKECVSLSGKNKAPEEMTNYCIAPKSSLALFGPAVHSWHGGRHVFFFFFFFLMFTLI
jgi:hypothetical protein